MVKRRYTKRKKAPQAKRVYRKKVKVDKSLANAKKFARFLQEASDADDSEE